MAYENKDPAEMLKQVDTAIESILIGGQSYKIGSRQLTRADLSMLNRMRDDLLAQINSQNSSSLLDDTVVAVFSGR